MAGSKALAFTGHQSESLLFGENELSAACIRLKALLLDEIMRRAEQGYDTFYCGAERGLDIIFGDHVLLVKMLAHPQLRLICVVPHENRPMAGLKHGGSGISICLNARTIWC